MTKEVAEASADVHGQAISAINDRERRIQEEHNRLNQLKDDLAKAQSAVGTEANQKAQIIAEAEEAIQQQRTQMITQVEQSMHEQSKLVFGRLSELQQEANSEKAAHDFEKKIREQAQGDLQRVSSQLLHEVNLRDYSFAEARQMKEELSSEKAKPTIAQQQLKAAYQEGRLLFVKVEKQELRSPSSLRTTRPQTRPLSSLRLILLLVPRRSFRNNFNNRSINKMLLSP